MAAIWDHNSVVSYTNSRPAATIVYQGRAPTAIFPSILLPVPTGANAFASTQVSTVAFPGSVPAVSGFDAAADSSQFRGNAPMTFK